MQLNMEGMQYRRKTSLRLSKWYWLVKKRKTAL